MKYIVASGLKRVRAQIEKLPEACILYIDDNLDLPKTKAKVKKLPFSKIGREVNKLSVATGALATVLTDSGMFPVEAFAAAIQRGQKAKIAETNLKAVSKGAELIENKT